MFGKKQRDDMVYLLWYGEATINGHTPTPEEQERFIEARQQSIRMAKMVFKVKDEEFAYTPNQPFPGM